MRTEANKVFIYSPNPPQGTEEQIIATAVFYPLRRAEVFGKISSKSFFNPELKTRFATLEKLYANGEEIDKSLADGLGFDGCEEFLPGIDVAISEVKESEARRVLKMTHEDNPDPFNLNGSDLIGRLSARIYSPTVKLDEPVPRFFIGSTQICTAGNLTTISAQPKAGKSAAIGAMIACTLAQGNDCLGFASSNPNGHALVHLDTEQCPFDHRQGIERALRRAGLTTAPDWLRSYCLTGFSADDVRASIRIIVEHSAKQFKGVHSVFIDGIADGAKDVNDPAETSALITELHNLAIEFDCPILSVIHVNPGSDFKTRGHLGSQLERKSETNLRLEKDSSETSVMWADKNRRAPIPKKTAPRFAWSDSENMHVTVKGITKSKDESAIAELTKLATQAFKDKSAMKRKELENTFKSILNASSSDAYRKVTKCLQLEIIKQNTAKRYILNA